VCEKVQRFRVQGSKVQGSKVHKFRGSGSRGLDLPPDAEVIIPKYFDEGLVFVFKSEQHI
jgi:hypothetical protein